MISCNLAITGLNVPDSAVSSIPVISSIRADKEWAGRIIGLTYSEPDASIRKSGLLDEVFSIPSPSDGEAALMQRLRQILHQTPIDVIMPTVYPERVSLSRLGPELKRLGVSPLLPHRDRRRLHQKQHLGEFGEAGALRCPQTMMVNAQADLEEAASVLGFPLVIKSALHEPHLACSHAEVLSAYKLARETWSLPLVAQEHVPGEQYSVVALNDRDRNLVGAVGLKKLGTDGKERADAAITVHDDALITAAKGVLSKLNWVGPLELDFVRPNPCESYYLFDLNPALPPSSYVAYRAGQNLALAAVRLAMGERVQAFASYEPGIISCGRGPQMSSPAEHGEEPAANPDWIFGARHENEARHTVVARP